MEGDNVTSHLVALARVALIPVLLVSLAGCGGGTTAQPTATPAKSGAVPTPTAAAAAKSSPTATPTAAAKASPTKAPSVQAADATARISESVSRLLLDDKVVFKSFHIEASGTDPS